MKPVLGNKENRSGQIAWDDNDSADNYQVDVFELQQSQNELISILTPEQLLAFDLSQVTKTSTFTQSNGEATSVDLGATLITGTPYLIRVTPVAGGRQGQFDLTPVTLRKYSILATSCPKSVQKMLHYFATQFSKKYIDFSIF